MKKIVLVLAVFLTGCASMPDRMAVTSGYFGEMAVNADTVEPNIGGAKFKVESKDPVFADGAFVNCTTGRIELVLDFIGAKLPYPVENPKAKAAISPLADYACKVVATRKQNEVTSHAFAGAMANYQPLKLDTYQMPSHSADNVGYQQLQEQRNQATIMQNQLNSYNNNMALQNMREASKPMHW